LVKGSPEVSVVIPCLNEAETLGTCIEKAARVMREHGITGEIVVADNGSSDDSRAIARRLGAIVVDVESKGYGHALMGGIAAAQGRFVIMGDADDSYDFADIPKFVEKLRQGFDLVLGCRLPSGGGTVLPGAMPWLHRWWGNPMFSLLAQRMFRVKVHDVYCGMRAFTKPFYERLDQRCTGMEFATEMIIKASLFGGSIAEVPITLHSDGRAAHLPHLKTFRDGWRTLRFFLLCSPRRLFLIPGGALILLGLVGYGPGDAGPDDCGRHLRRPHPAVFEPGDPLRLPGGPVRAALDDVWRHRAAAATESPPRPLVRYRDSRKGPGGFADSAGLRSVSSPGRNRTMACRELRRLGLSPHDAVDHSWRDHGCARFSNDALEFLHQHPSHAAHVTPKTICATARRSTRCAHGITTVITTANSVRRGGEDNVDTVDANGTRSLIDAQRPPACSTSSTHPCSA
jgi:hypothetical protein